jgi:molecular chaperone GrpE
MHNMSQESKEKEQYNSEEMTETIVENPMSEPETEDEMVATEGKQQEELSVVERLEAELREQEDKYLRLLAEYDNFRKRSQREREAAWTTAKAETAAAFLPVYDNLERALKQETEDHAYAKGVQMTMDQLKNILDKLGIEEISALGQTFDPAMHNAVMHVEDDTLAPNTVAEVFETGFQSNGKVIRFALVKVAN